MSTSLATQATLCLSLFSKLQCNSATIKSVATPKRLAYGLSTPSHKGREKRSLANLADALPLQILPPNLSVDHDLLVLEQHHDVRSAEQKEAELVALLQPSANLGRQVDRGNVAHPDR